MSKIYEVRSISHNEKPYHWGAKRSFNEAQKLLENKTSGKRKEWAEKYHKKWWIEEIDTTGAFQIPSKPMPRDIYSIRDSVAEEQNGYATKLKIDVLNEREDVIAQYTRNLGRAMQTFEPFRQGDKVFALISPDYTATSVMDLETGKIIASEVPDPGGFCPVGFYVPDWWDINDGSTLPGSYYWTDDYEKPSGNFGFVWGCIWGDDSSWKIQYLDLSNIQNGKIVREERFGHVKLAANPDVHPKEFIRCYCHGEGGRVTLRTENDYDLQTGKVLGDYD